MKTFNRIARAAAAIMFLLLLYGAWHRAGWLGCLMVIGGAAVTSMLWSACPSSQNRGSNAALQVTIEDEEHCHTHFNGHISDIALCAPVAIASICIGVEHASDRMLTRDKVMRAAELIMNDKSEAVKILNTVKI